MLPSPPTATRRLQLPPRLSPDRLRSPATTDMGLVQSREPLLRLLWHEEWGQFLLTSRSCPKVRLIDSAAPPISRSEDPGGILDWPPLPSCGPVQRDRTPKSPPVGGHATQGRPGPGGALRRSIGSASHLGADGGAALQLHRQWRRCGSPLDLSLPGEEIRSIEAVMESPQAADGREGGQDPEGGKTTPPQCLGVVRPSRGYSAPRAPVPGARPVRGCSAGGPRPRRWRPVG